MTAAISSDMLVLRYRRSKEPQVRDLSFDARAQVTALVGRNGAGKSTLMKALVSLKKVDAGRLRVLGIDLSDVSSRPELLRAVGYLPQHFGYVPHFTVTEFVSYGGWLKKMPSGSLNRSVLEAIERVGLTNKKNERLGRLSGGMLRRAGIAQATVHDPQLLVLDEPTAGLDPEQRIRFRLLTSVLAERQKIILSSHLIEDVRAVAKDVLVLDDGELRFFGAVSEMEALARSKDAGSSPLEQAYSRLIATDKSREAGTE